MCFHWYYENLLSYYFTCIKVLSAGIDFLAALTSSSILGSLDKKYLVKLNLFLAPVLRSSCSRFVRCWRAKTDGWAVSTFHSNCDGKGPTVTIIQVGSYIFGGYTDVFWSSSEYHFISRAGFFQSVSLLNGKRLFCYYHLLRLHFSVL